MTLNIKSKILGSLIGLAQRIISSNVVVGLVFGLLTTCTIGPAYLFLFADPVVEHRSEKRVAAIVGFLMGQLILVFSIYERHWGMVLTQPYTVMSCALPLLLYIFLADYQESFFDSSKNIERFGSLFVFLAYLIIQILNPFLLPSSTLLRVFHSYLFRSNNQILFIIGHSCGWIIGQIVVLKSMDSNLIFLQEKLKISTTKYRVAEIKEYVIRGFTILVFVTFLFSLGRLPFPIFINTLNTINEQEREAEEKEKRENLQAKMDEMNEDEIQKAEQKKKEMAEKKAKKKEILDRDPENTILLEEEIEEDQLVQPLRTLIFDEQRWNHPLRYIQTTLFEKPLKSRISQYFFYPCESDGKHRISFTYLPSLAIFFRMLEKKNIFRPIEKCSPEELYKSWVYTNEQKVNNLNIEFINRLKTLDKGSMMLDVLEKKTRFCNHETEHQCLPKIYDPFLNGSSRGTTTQLDSSSSLNDYLNTSINTFNESGYIEIWKNKIHDILLPIKYQEFKEKPHTFTEVGVTANYKDQKMIAESNPFTEVEIEVTADHNDEIIMAEPNASSKDGVIADYNHKTMMDAFIRIKEITKELYRWLYKLEEPFYPTEEILLRKGKFVIVYTFPDEKPRTNDTRNAISNPKSTGNSTEEEPKEVLAIFEYSKQSDFNRELIKGSIRARRRKIIPCELFEPYARSPLFSDRSDNSFFFSLWNDFETTVILIQNLLFRNWMEKKKELKNPPKTDKGNQKEKERRDKDKRIRRAVLWETISNAQALRGCLLITQSFLRKQVILPSLIIIKNTVRMLFCHSSEWHKDWEEWKKEIHIKCTYTGIQPETEFPENWLNEGIQIKILFPFRIKPWQGAQVEAGQKNKKEKENHSFLTVYGRETDQPFGSPREGYSFFIPIFEELEKFSIKVKNNYFLFLIIFTERTKSFLEISKEKTIWIMQTVRFIEEKRGELAKLSQWIQNQSGKNSITSISNEMRNELSIPIRSNWTNYSQTEQKRKDLIVRTNTIRHQINEIKNKKISLFFTPDISPRPGETNYNSKESPKSIFNMQKIKSTRLIPKWRYLVIYFIEQIYTDIFLCMINITKFDVQRFLELKKKRINKYNYNEKKNQEDIRIKNTIENLSSLKNSKKKSDVSQAYVFFKLSQTPTNHKNFLRSAFQYDGTSLFVKDRIKEDFKRQGIFDCQLKHKKLTSFASNEWKNWLRSNYVSKSYLSPTVWYNIKSQKPRSNKKENAKKHYRYNLLSYKYLNRDISINKNFRLNNIQESNRKRKYLSWRNINLSLNKKNKIEDFMRRETCPTPNKGLSFNYLKIFEKLQKTSFVSLVSHKETNPVKQKKTFFDWMGMNEQRLNQKRTKYRYQHLFSPQLLLIYKSYKRKPWIIPIKSLLFDCNETIIQKNQKQKTSLKLEKKKKELEQVDLESTTQEPWDIGSDLSNKEKEEPEQADLGSVTQKPEDIPFNLPNKEKREKDFKEKKEEELNNVFWRNYSLCQVKLNENLDSGETLNENLTMYAFLLKLKNPTALFLSFLRTDELYPDLLLDDEMDLSLGDPKEIDIIIPPDIPDLLTQGIYSIIPARMSKNCNRHFLMYQTLAISIVHKNKYQTNEDYFFVPENILSPRRRRELRIRTCLSLNSGNMSLVDGNYVLFNENNIGNYNQFMDMNNRLDINTKKLMNLKLYLWPNYRLEDLGCMNRYWFDANNGSRFSMLRIRMYPRLKIC
uniref:Protein TIC 214 n=1 Tax=Circaeaster agrestis TaxID=39288 RepID=A0A6M8Q146_9MAGN|nr:hypothetical protein RF1 [Circaeaster agrestis]